MQVQICLLELRTGRPVKMVLLPRGVVPGPRPQASGGHVVPHTPMPRGRFGEGRGAHHPRRRGTCRHHSRDHERLPAWRRGLTESRTLSSRRLRCRTNNPRAAMRGFGSVQAVLRMRPRWTSWQQRSGSTRSKLRLRNVLKSGDSLDHRAGTCGAPRRRRGHRTCCCSPARGGPNDRGGARAPGAPVEPSTATAAAPCVGFSVSVRTSCTEAASTHYSRHDAGSRDGVATITCAAVEVGQGFVTLAQQIAAEVLGVTEVIPRPLRARPTSARRGRPRQPPDLDVRPGRPKSLPCGP